MKLKIKSFVKIQLDSGFFILIIPETGKWIVVDRRYLELIRLLQEERDFTHLRGKATLEEIQGLTGILAKSGFLRDFEYHFSAMNHPSKSGMPKHVVVNVTNNCNLGCIYCYARSPMGQSSARAMKFGVMKRIIDEILDINQGTLEKITILFHGGEPLLNFPLIQESVLYAENICANNIHFEMQTNATLLNQDHINFCKEHDIGVGLSIDGPGSINDALRPLKTGGGSGGKVISAIKLLQENKLRFGVITVLTNTNISHVREILEFIINLNIRFISINPFFCGGAGHGRKDLAPDCDALFNAYIAIYNFLLEYNKSNLDKDKQLEERNIKHLIRNILWQDGSYMCMRVPCGAGLDTIGIDTDGRVYICDDFIGESRFKLGNIIKSSLRNIMKGINLSKISSVPQCKSCKLRKLCNGICPAHVYYASDSPSKIKNAECHFRQKMILFLINELATGRLPIELIDRTYSYERSSTYYFNITYNCNNRCTFCASSLTDSNSNNKLNEITAEGFEKMLGDLNTKPGDRAIINGGEPTISRHLKEILEICRERGLVVHLFSNGRKFANFEYTSEIMLTNVAKISVPLYTSSPDDHDRLTCKKGSFSDTVNGLKNILKIASYHHSRIQTEIKLLFMEPTLKENAGLIKWIASEFPTVGTISLNTLIVSDLVNNQYREFIPTSSDLMDSINNCLDIARLIGIGAKIVLNDVPICFIRKHNWSYVNIDAAIPQNRQLKYYIDPYCTEELNVPNNTSSNYSGCKECLFQEICGFRWKRYLDKNTEYQSTMFLGSSKLPKEYKIFSSY